MPWQVGDVDSFKKGLTDTEKRQWVEVANSALASCMKDGGTDCEASAIKQANGVTSEAQHDHAALGEKILEAVFDEGATVKATVQGFLRAAHAVTKHPNVPAKIKKQVEDLRNQLASHTWADLDANSDGHIGTADASEATREALQSIAEATKTENGKAYPSSDFAYVPDPEKPSEWKLRLTATPGGAPDSGIVGAAIAALGPGGFRGQKVDIPAADLPAVLAKVRAAWKKANPDKSVDEMPATIKEAASEHVDFIETGSFVEVGESDG